MCFGAQSSFLHSTQPTLETYPCLTTLCPAALHAGMERIKTCVRVARAASKKPQNRSAVDVNFIAAETQGVQLLVQHGPGVHRDLCHVLQHCSLGQMSSFRLPGDHPHGLYIFVMQVGGLARARSCAEFVDCCVQVELAC